MDSSGLGGAFLSVSSGGLLDLESPIPRHQPTHLGNSSIANQCHLNFMSGVESDNGAIAFLEIKGSSAKGNLISSKGKAIVPENAHNYNMSEEDDQSYMEDGNDDNMDEAKGKNGSPWQRMKWTDNVVRLLIAVVSCVGEDGMHEGAEGFKRKSGVLQKKGKWKTVSKVMISKGCHVSPQQCEDKFNDLNKRYKKLNEILGRGTSCRVVETPELMDSMPHLSAKAKDDVRKILSSKHLFYKEICAYHNGQRIPGCHDIDMHGYSLPVERLSKETNGSEEEEAEENHDSEDDEMNNEDDDNAGINVERMEVFRQRMKFTEENGHFWSLSTPQNSFEAEMAAIFQDPSKPLWEQRVWIKKQMLQLQEESVSFEAQAFELEKQRFKWLRYCKKKDRELERLRLENERMKLENEQKVLLVRQRELEINLRRSEASSEHSTFGIDKLNGRDRI